ncbi:MAG: TraB/GumN family protein [Xanthomonadales bacterium]|nr:TraB/GumN family protein [Xanthomonadales bacterium]
MSAFVRLLACAALAFTSSTLVAQESAPADAAVLESIVVRGEQPGPGLWKVTRGGHVLWILGTTRPLPRDMTWLSRDVEAVIGESGEVILPPRVRMNVKGGLLGGLLLMPTLVGARDLPEDRTLADVVPADLHARWSALRMKYLPRDKGVDRRRPVFAAFELFDAAIDQSGLSFKDIVDPVVRRAAKRGKVMLTEPGVELRIDRARAAIKEFKKASLDDLDCLSRTIEIIESRIDTLRQRANAWAIGDIEALASLPAPDHYQACQDALMRSAVAEQRGIDELPARARQAWIDAVDQALTRHAVSFATVGVVMLTEADGFLDRLRALGVEVEAPL